MRVLVFEDAELRCVSTTEAEYVALAVTVKEAMLVRCTWSFTLPSSAATCITAFEDNEVARNLAQKPVRKSKSKPIYLRRHCLRELVFRVKFIITHVESKGHHADFLTKSLANAAF